ESSQDYQAREAPCTQHGEVAADAKCSACECRNQFYLRLSGVRNWRNLIDKPHQDADARETAGGQEWLV
ncbi:MAG TPA: hypothetical protein VK206_20200, partial [Anaerolineales bacterium]|nr:hypothetical protein [Anaerolineales bacterium]